MERIGDYEILRELGRGGMAEVFLAEKPLAGGLRKPVVLKRILPHLRTHAEYAGLFAREAALALTVRHPNLVQILDFQKISDEHILVMEFVDGLSVADLPSGSLSDDLIAYIGTEVATGLSALHEANPGPILHRDVSPGNILLDRHGSVKLTDFGIACLSDDPHRQRQTQARGTWRYLAPERRGGYGMYPSSDLYSLGMVLAELMEGPPSASVETPSGLSRWLDDLAEAGHRDLLAHIRPWLETEPEKRPASSREAAESLRALVNPLTCRETLAREAGRHVSSMQAADAPAKADRPTLRRTALLGSEEAVVSSSLASTKSMARKGRWFWVALCGLLLILSGIYGFWWRSGNDELSVLPREEAQQSPSLYLPLALWTVDANPACMIRLDGDVIGKSPLRLHVPPGRHTVGCLDASGARHSERTVFLLPGPNPELLIKIRAEKQSN